MSLRERVHRLEIGRELEKDIVLLRRRQFELEETMRAMLNHFNLKATTSKICITEGSDNG